VVEEVEAAEALADEEVDSGKRARAIFACGANCEWYGEVAADGEAFCATNAEFGLATVKPPEVSREAGERTSRERSRKHIPSFDGDRVTNAALELLAIAPERPGGERGKRPCVRSNHNGQNQANVKFRVRTNVWCVLIRFSRRQQTSNLSEPLFLLNSDTSCAVHTIPCRR
jgi:hypothetical protein